MTNANETIEEALLAIGWEKRSAEVAAMRAALTAAEAAQLRAQNAAVDLTARLADAERERDEARAERNEALARASLHETARAAELIAEEERTEAIASRDAALAALARVVDAGAELRERLDSLDDEVLDSPVRQADHWLGEVMRAATDPAALGAKVLEEAREEGASEMQAVIEAEARRVFGTGVGNLVASFDPATVCRAARKEETT